MVVALFCCAMRSLGLFTEKSPYMFYVIYAYNERVPERCSSVLSHESFQCVQSVRASSCDFRHTHCDIIYRFDKHAALWS
jgi:uncharacterized protein (DUF924 family)